MKQAVGIDLGTTYSAVAILSPGGGGCSFKNPRR